MAIVEYMTPYGTYPVIFDDDVFHTISSWGVSSNRAIYQNGSYTEFFDDIVTSRVLQGTYIPCIREQGTSIDPIYVQCLSAMGAYLRYFDVTNVPADRYINVKVYNAINQYLAISYRKPNNNASYSGVWVYNTFYDVDGSSTTSVRAPSNHVPFGEIRAWSKSASAPLCLDGGLIVFDTEGDNCLWFEINTASSSTSIDQIAITVRSRYLTDAQCNLLLQIFNNFTPYVPDNVAERSAVTKLINSAANTGQTCVLYNHALSIQTVLDLEDIGYTVESRPCSFCVDPKYQYIISWEGKA